MLLFHPSLVRSALLNDRLPIQALPPLVMVCDRLSTSKFFNLDCPFKTVQISPFYDTSSRSLPCMKISCFRTSILPRLNVFSSNMRSLFWNRLTFSLRSFAKTLPSVIKLLKILSAAQTITWQLWCPPCISVLCLHQILKSSSVNFPKQDDLCSNTRFCRLLNLPPLKRTFFTKMFNSLLA